MLTASVQQQQVLIASCYLRSCSCDRTHARNSSFAVAFALPCPQGGCKTLLARLLSLSLHLHTSCMIVQSCFCPLFVMTVVLCSGVAADSHSFGVSAAALAQMLRYISTTIQHLHMMLCCAKQCYCMFAGFVLGHHVLCCATLSCLVLCWAVLCCAAVHSTAGQNWRCVLT